MMPDQYPISPPDAAHHEGTRADLTGSDLLISLVIPARNEAAALATLLPRCRERVETIFVVDNGSTDGTAEVARSAGCEVVDEPRAGYGSACAAGLRRALEVGSRIVVFMDADGSDDPAEMEQIIAPLIAGDADLVIGRRETRGLMPWHQGLGTKLVCSVLSLGFGERVPDIGPFRAAKAEVLTRLPLIDRGFGWTAEMQGEAMRLGFVVTYVDVSWRRGLGDSEISGSWRGVLRAGRDLLRHSLREVLLFRLSRIRRFF